MTDGDAAGIPQRCDANQMRSKYLPLLLALLISLSGLVAQLTFPLFLNLNCAVYLLAAQIILRGGQPYVDFWDSNPPLIMYLNVVPTLLHGASGIPLVMSFDIFIWSVSVFSILCVFLLFRNKRTYVEGLLVCIGLGAALAMAGYDYGEREQLFILLYLPYLCLRNLRWNEDDARFSTFLSVFLGLAAGIGTCIKPYFFIAPVAAEIYWLLRFRRFGKLLRAETFSFAAVPLIYAICLLSMPPTALHNFLDVLMPIMSKGYSAYNNKLYYIITMKSERSLAFAVLASIVAAWPLRRYSSLLIPLSICSLSGYASYVLQQKGWGYHAIPMLVSAMVALLIETYWVAMLAFRRYRLASPVASPEELNPIAAIDARFNRQLYLVSSLGVACLLIFLTVQSVKAVQSWRTPAFKPISPGEEFIAKHTSANDRIMILATDVELARLMPQLGLLPGSRYSCLFFLTIYESLGDHQRMHADEVESAEGQIINDCREDVDKWHPKLIVIRDKDAFRPSFSLLRILEQHQFLKRCQTRYKLVGKFADLSIYQIAEETEAGPAQ